MTEQKDLLKRIVFESPRFVALDKPPLWLSTPSRQGKEDPRPCVGTLLQERLGRQIYPTHRLDFEVSGLLVFAKDSEAHRLASEAFESQRMHKVYQAISSPAPQKIQVGAPFTIQSKLSKGKRRAYLDDDGKPCETQVELIKNESDHSIWKVSPKTGRPHQIRFELSRLGAPILGDTLYGSDCSWEVGIALRCLSILPSEDTHLTELGWPSDIQLPGILYKR